MLSSRFIRRAGLDRLGPRADVPERAISLAFTARFVDEILSSAWDVLTPTFRRVFGLSLVQIGLLDQVLTWVALVVEPIAGTLIDLRSRRLLMGFGAAAVGTSLLVMAGAPSFAVLLVGFALYGVGSGPLAHTADVVVVETFADNAERAYSRATFIDTCGALAGPALIAAAGFAGVSWRVVLAMLGLGALAYAYGIRRTSFPAPPRVHNGDRHPVRDMLDNVVTVVRHAEARRALLVLFWFDVFETAFLLEYVWLNEGVGLSEPAVALYAAAAQVVDLVALIVLDRWLTRWDACRILRISAVALIVLPAAWVAAPGVGGRILVGIPLSFAYAMVWPLAKSRSLTVIPELAGATQAITALFAVVPLAVAQAAFSEAVGIGPAMAVTAAVAAGLMLLSVRSSSGEGP
jgi:MFS family permease